MSQDALSPAAVSSVIAVVNAVCATSSAGAVATSGNSSGIINSSGSSPVVRASTSLASNIGVSQTILSIVSKMNVARAESSVVAAHGNDMSWCPELYGIVAV